MHSLDDLGSKAGMPQTNTCCGALGEDKETECDFKYWPTGPAWEDTLDFMRDEQLWLTHYLRAWHIATENGMDLHYLNPEEGPKRDDKTPEE